MCLSTELRADLDVVLCVGGCFKSRLLVLKGFVSLARVFLKVVKHFSPPGGSICRGFQEVLRGGGSAVGADQLAALCPNSQMNPFITPWSLACWPSLRTTSSLSGNVVFCVFVNYLVNGGSPKEIN